MKEKTVFQFAISELLIILFGLIAGGIFLGGRMFGDFQYGHYYSLVIILALGPLFMKARRKMVPKK